MWSFEAVQAALWRETPMRKSLLILSFTSFLISACSLSDDNGNDPPQSGTAACTIDAQKQFVLDTMNDVYFWSYLLPASVDLDAYATPEELLDFLRSFQPLDDFSYIDAAAADAQFFGAGQYEGYGFSSRFEAADDLRFTRVFSSGPAFLAGFARGQRILTLNGRTIADIQETEGVGVLFSQSPLEFMVRRLDGSEYTAVVGQGLVTIDPVPQWRIIDRPDGSSVGYLELATFISTAEPAFTTAFAAFMQAGVNDVIIDLRYNGGGLVSIAELLGDFLGGVSANNLTFSKTLFNADNAALNRTAFFQQLSNSINLSRLVVIATDGTASASELITNSMEPHADVSIVGSTTFGKPVGQLGIEFCDKIIRPTAFESVNANDEGGYFDGLPADCDAIDELSVAVGADTDPNLTAALTLLDTGACPAVLATPANLQKPLSMQKSLRTQRSGKPWQEFANAW
jgi:carboxyl-terminal processing protease